MARNIEIKVRVDGHERLRAIAAELGARSAGTIHQIDRYYALGGARRQKLREIDGSTFEWIDYDRPEGEGVRSSDYSVVSYAAGECRLNEILREKPLVVVEKRRELWLLDNVRIHLDEVRGVGTFLELEAVVDQQHDDERCRAGLDRLLDAFGVERAALVRASYSDLLLG